MDHTQNFKLSREKLGRPKDKADKIATLKNKPRDHNDQSDTFKMKKNRNTNPSDELCHDSTASLLFYE